MALLTIEKNVRKHIFLKSFHTTISFAIGNSIHFHCENKIIVILELKWSKMTKW